WPRDWSSDVCSSDLPVHLLVTRVAHQGMGTRYLQPLRGVADDMQLILQAVKGGVEDLYPVPLLAELRTHLEAAERESRRDLKGRSEERRVGKECISW